VSQRVLFDTTAYVQSMRMRIELPTSFIPEEELLVFFSSVVAQELYAGANHPDIQRAINQHWYRALENERLVTPLPPDWRNTGLLLQQVSRRYGSPRVAHGRMRNDALIAVSAQRYRLTVFSANAADFRALQEFCDFEFRPFDLSAT